MLGQLSFFSADARPPALDDLDGALAGPGQMARRAGAARLSLPVEQPWRADVLLTALAGLGVAAESVTAATGQLVVRTGFLPELDGLAARWVRGAVKRPPADLAADGPRLRWWCLAAGNGEPGGYVLSVGAGDELCWPALGAALAAAGLPATLVRPRGCGAVFRLVGRRRLQRLRELVGDPPSGVPATAWPDGGRHSA